MILNGDAKEEIAIMISGLSQDDRPVVSLSEAILLSSKFPLLALIINVLAWCVFYLKVIFISDNDGLPMAFYIESFELIMSYGGWMSLVVTLMLTFIFTLIFISQAMIFLSIPKSLREKSIVIGTIKSGIAKISWSLLVILSLVLILGVFSSSTFIMKFAVPSAVFISIFIFMIYISMQSVRFGLGPFISAAKHLFRK